MESDELKISGVLLPLKKPLRDLRSDINCKQTVDVTTLFNIFRQERVGFVVFAPRLSHLMCKDAQVFSIDTMAKVKVVH